MRMQRNFYEVLGLPRTATQQEIKDKYHSLARLYHPDRAKDKELADRLFVQINRAYTTLKDDVKRTRYDASLEAITGAAHPNVQRQQNSGQAPAPAPVTPQQVREWYDQASRLQLKGDLTQAIKVLSRATEADPNHFPGILLMGDLLAQSGKPVEALAMFERAAKIQPANRLLREKIARLNAVNARRSTNPGQARPGAPGPARPAAANIVPPQGSPQNPETASAEPSKSIFDRLMHRK
jgi:curved DNA-binding protein CbpA